VPELLGRVEGHPRTARPRRLASHPAPPRGPSARRPGGMGTPTPTIPDHRGTAATSVTPGDEALP